MSELSEVELEMYKDWYIMLRDTIKKHGRPLPDTFVMHMGEGAIGKDVMDAISADNPGAKVVMAGNEVNARFTVIPINALLGSIIHRFTQNGSMAEALYAESVSGGQLSQTLLMETFRMLTRAGKADVAMTVMGALAPAVTSNNIDDFGKRREVVIFTIEKRDGGIWYVDVEVKKKDGKVFISEEPPALRQYNGENIGLLTGMFADEAARGLDRLSELFGGVKPNWRKGDDDPTAAYIQ